MRRWRPASRSSRWAAEPFAPMRRRRPRLRCFSMSGRISDMRVRPGLSMLMAAAVLLLPGGSGSNSEAQSKNADHVIVVTLDGMRWQEVFSGMSSALVNETDGGVRNAEAIERRFGGPTAEERRRRLMPFLWSVVAKEGQIFG